MKLLVSNNRRFLPFLLLILIASGVIFYVVVQAIVREEADEKLLNNEKRIVQILEKGELPVSIPPLMEVQDLLPVMPNVTNFTDTTIFDPLEMENDLFRQLYSRKTIQGRTYEIINRSPILDAKELIGTITALSALLLLFLLGSSYWLNRRATRKLWSPFYQVLAKLRSFNANQDQPIQLPDTQIDEFNDLNFELATLMEKVRLEYSTLNEFTGDVSHELQTPLSVMRAKLEQLINGNPVAQKRLLFEMYEETTQMSKMIQELLLLARIEGREYKRDMTVHLDGLMENQISRIQEMEVGDNIHWEVNIKPVIKNEVNSVLVDLLLKNLLENAIRYSTPNGTIQVLLNSLILEIKNKGDQPLDNPEKLFNRFYRESPANKHSSGLGLAIAKKISILHGWDLYYQFNQGFHAFKIVFQPGGIQN